MKSARGDIPRYLPIDVPHRIQRGTDGVKGKSDSASSIFQSLAAFLKAFLFTGRQTCI
jgi:hypothetical protein